MMLGHYTNTQGLLGIIQSKTLRATNIKFLNDEHEFIHALELIKRLIKDIDPARAAPYEITFNEFREKITSKITILDESTSESIFTLSFSQKTDLLSQWRGYCPNNDGYCLLLDTEKVKNSASAKFDECHFFQCIYDNEKKEEQLRNILNKYWLDYRNGDDKQKGISVENLRREILLLASHFKHPAFEEESEHRIVIFLNFMPDEKVKFREGRFSIIPFIEIDIKIENIKKITIGPTNRKDLAERGLKCFLETTIALPYPMLDITIDKSEIPYRS